VIVASHIVSSQQKSWKRVAVAEAFAAGVIFGTQEGHATQLVDAADRAYARFLSVQPFWK